jgi:hypothetical protein
VVATDSAGNTATATVEIEVTASDLPGADVQAAIAAVFAGPGDVAAPAGDGGGIPADDDAGGGVPGVVTVMVVVAAAVAVLGAFAFRRLRRRAHDAG